MSTQTIQWQSWDLAAESDRRFNRLIVIVGIPLLIISIVVPFLELVGLTRGGGTLTGSRYVELLAEEPAPVADKVEEPQPAEQDEPDPVEPEAPAEPQPQPTAPPAQPPEVQQQRAVERARETASRSGVMAFADQLQALHSGVQSIQRPDQALATIDRSGGSDGGDSRVFEQSASAASSGIGSPSGTGATRRAQSGSGLGERRTTQVESPVGVGPDRTRPGQGGDRLIAGRTLEEIQLIFDRNKGAITSIYNRAARDNPNLGAGKIVISLTIAPNGSVTDCKLVSSTFNNPDLERKIVQRVMLMNFGAKDVPAFTYPNYPITFLPS
ncbi:AgmX/PglI C-terminal domain-containing protein [Sinimarinibacterium flocculans]|uniref:Outer membrane transport energization protein TonB n=1 Tax=Sinimarinibacterium flocculans TaxID=985250 RepID=A0A318EF27_9GAMM|nr:AgmX/PglI C-terminal domain-containing protein [Sinimarinibacterium flocculans]PXV71397.1 outer membrane transport energization protein TonB [Sinimarinibacterium flocculans]